tara:strand:- start:416 stop:1276 length:861 start_codon:yes stop_codon:yes gene_type:complete
MINHKSIKYFEKIILLLTNFFKFLQNKDSLRVLVYHHIEKKNFNKFYNHLKYLKKEWNFITPSQFENHLRDKKKLKGKNLLLTFDDGFKSNFNVEKEVLKKLNIKCIFFVPTEFIKLSSLKKSKKFLSENILDSFSEKTNELNNMSVENIKSLLKKGHVIGSHTKTHANLGKIKNLSKLKKEIIGSNNDLKKLLNININHFAFTYGNYESMNKESLKMSFSKYRFVYSCLRGNNYYTKKGTIIRRDTIYLNRGIDLAKIFLSGLIDIKYFFNIKSINSKLSNYKNI